MGFNASLNSLEFRHAVSSTYPFNSIVVFDILFNLKFDKLNPTKALGITASFAKAGQ